MTMTSNRDVTNSAHQIQMTTICHWINPPHIKNFCVRHWLDQKDIGIKKDLSRQCFEL